MQKFGNCFPLLFATFGEVTVSLALTAGCVDEPERRSGNCCKIIRNAFYLTFLHLITMGGNDDLMTPRQLLTNISVDCKAPL